MKEPNNNMDYLTLFKMPTPMKITGRSSSITNAFISSIIPVIKPTAEEIKEAIDILGMTPETLECAYCGDYVSEWDHLRPLIKDKKPTGYISEIHNLVPSCGKCNQSKGNKEWRTWMEGPAKLSPSTRGIKDIKKRIERLEIYENWHTPTKIDFEAIVGKAIWSKHLQNLEQVKSLMSESQKLAVKINRKVTNTYLDL